MADPVPAPQQTIALVDDDRNILTTVSIGLQAEGFATRVYSDGSAALKALLENPPDLAVFDIKMPRMDGLELLRQLREKSALPVIFLTSLDSHEAEAQGLALGAMDYITKPFQIEIVRARVRNLLELHHARHTLQLALGSARLGIWQWELNGDHVWFDNSMPSPLGYAAGEMPSGPQDWADFVHPDDLLGLELCRQKLRRNVPHFEIELRLRNKQDTWTWVQVAGETLKRTGQKNTIIGTFRDIQRRKQAEQALAAREAELSTLIAALPDMILTLDMSGDISHCHLPAEMEDWPAFNCKPGQSLTQALPSALSGQLVQHIVDLMSGGGSRQFNADIDQNGRRYRLNIKITCREDKEGYPIGFLLIIRNLFQADSTLGNPASIV